MTSGSPAEPILTCLHFLAIEFALGSESILPSRAPRKEKPRPALKKRGAARPRREPKAATSDSDRAGLAFGHVLKEAHRSFSKVLDKSLKPLGITLSQWYFLRELWDEEGLTQRELSRRLGISDASTTSAIELLVREGLLERRRKPGDHRSQHLYLTRAGRSLRESVLAIALEVNAKALRGFSDAQVAGIRRQIFQIIDNLNQDQL